MSWQGKDMWPQMQSFQLLTAVWKSRVLHWGLLSSGRVTRFPSFPHPLLPGQHKPWPQAPALSLPPSRQYHKDMAQCTVVQQDFLTRLTQLSTSITCSSASYITLSAVRKGCLLPLLTPYSFSCNCFPSEHTAPLLSPPVPDPSRTFLTGSVPQQNKKSFQPWKRQVCFSK